MQVSEFAFNYGLNAGFFDYNPPKAEVWVKEAPLIAERLETVNHGIVAPTSAGKTVMALLSIVINPRRTLFLVPLRRLTNRHQALFVALCDTWQTRCITGETKESDRIWDDTDDKIVFATAHVVVSELMSNPWLLTHFDLIVFDEMHNASSTESVYAQVATLADQLQIRRLALSASPGNTKSQIQSVQANCKLDELVRITIPTPDPIVRVVWAEEAGCYHSGQQNEVEHFVHGQQMRLSEKFANLAVHLPLGKEYKLEPDKFRTRQAAAKLRQELYGLSDSPVKFMMMGVFEEFMAWTHIYSLITEESFLAVQGYVDKTLAKKTAKYAKRLREDFRLKQLLNWLPQLIHPKIEVLLQLMQWLTTRNKQAIIFVGNKETAKECYQYLTAVGLACDVMFGSGQMKHEEQEAVLERMETGEIQSIIATTVLREGFNLSVDVIINMALPSSAIDLIQRSGRAGRHCHPAEIIYVATKLERLKLIGLRKKVEKLSLLDLSALSSPPAAKPVKKRKTKGRFSSKWQPNLFELDSQIQ